MLVLAKTRKSAKFKNEGCDEGDMWLAPPPPKSINNGQHTNNNVNGELSDIKYPQCSTSNSNCSVPGRLTNYYFLSKF